MSRVALVTGATRGIGLEAARGLLSAGLRVLVAGRDLDTAASVTDALLDEVGGADPDDSSWRARPVLLDVADPASIDRLARELAAEHVEVDVLVNNAGVCWSEGPLAIDEAAFAEQMATNVYGPWLLMRAFVPGMVERGYGRVVNVSSGSGSFGEGLDLGSYSVSKAMLNALTVTVAREVPSGSDVVVTALCPGWVATDMGGPDAPVAVVDAAAGVVRAATAPSGSPTAAFTRDGRSIPW
jgi:NAD(P)-dependent dehydrogenase (short-subunit alcohol dehydrogenase family)